MATPVSKWSGQFDCTGPCKRKRLMGSEFSRKAMDLYRKSAKPLRCKSCIEKAQEVERDLASHRVVTDTRKSIEVAVLLCSACSEEKPQEAYNKTQLRKQEKSRRCRECVTQAEIAEKATLASSKEEKLAAAEKRVAKADKGGSAVEKLQAAAALSALQAEIVTGLKPTKLLRVRTRK